VAGDYYGDQWLNGHFLDGPASQGGGAGHGQGGQARVATLGADDRAALARAAALLSAIADDPD
jgi:hypothetical protein